MACDCNSYVYEQGHPCFAQCHGGTLSDDQWYEQEIRSRPDTFDTAISKAQWIAWRQYWDDGSKKFRSENVDSDGNAIGGTGFEKPTDCPDGTTKFGSNQCLPVNDPRIQAAWNPQGQGGGGGGGGGGATPAAAAPKPSGAQTQLPYTGNELVDTLANMFNYRAGIFGTGDPYQSGATSRAPKGKEIAGAFTPGGGLWWGEQSELEKAVGSLMPQGGGGGTAPAAVPPKKPKGGGGAPGFGDPFPIGTTELPPWMQPKPQRERPKMPGGGGRGILENALMGVFY